MIYSRIFSVFSTAILSLLMTLILIPAGTVLAQTILTSPTSGPVGTEVSIEGTGFTANAAFRIHFAYGTAYQSVVYSGIVSTDGVASGLFNVPQVPYGSYTVRVETSSVNAANTAFTVVPKISLSVASAKVGTPIVVTGTGFTANRGVTVTFDGSTVISTSTNSYGIFNASFNIPASTTGSHTVIARDGVHTISTNISVIRSIVISPTSGTPGTTLTITGTGFSANRLVTITFAGSTVATVPATLLTNSVGSFSVTMNVPDGSRRNVQIVARDGISSASVSFLVEAGISLTPTSGGIGTQVNIKGVGFREDKQVNVIFNSITLIQPITNSKGSFSVDLSIPTSTGGQHIVMATDGTNSVTAVFTIQTSITITTNKGEVGTLITISGSGFGSKRRATIYFDNTRIKDIDTDNYGSFTAGFNVPTSPGGKHTVTANDGIYSGNINFTTLPSLALDPIGSHMGGKVTVSGTGFAIGRAVDIRLGNTQVKTTTTDASGSFAIEFTVPQLDVGSYTVTANDGVNTVTADFTITTSFSIEPNTGYVGASVTIKGDGFQGTVTIKYDDDVIASTMAGANGELFTTLAIPPSISGEHAIIVSDTTNSLQLVFKMESTSPSVPLLINPQSGSREKARPTLTWQAVNDPSGVIYNLQIAADAAFTNILLQKAELTTSQYTLTQMEKLKTTSKEDPYYWRVKAIDLASNQSEWSTPGSFFVSFIADWLKYTLIGLGAIIGTILIFWLGMITGKRIQTSQDNM